MTDRTSHDTPHLDMITFENTSYPDASITQRNLVIDESLAVFTSLQDSPLEDLHNNKSDLTKLDGEFKRAKETGRLRLYRQRVRSERDILQRQEKQLQEQLKRLQQPKNLQTVSNLGFSSELWEAIAIQQRHERHQAEEEQKRLKATIKSQNECIEALKQVISCPQP